MKTMILTLALLIGSQAHAMSPGRYAQAQGDGSADLLTVDDRGVLSLELTRQVGGPGGLSNDGVVPYQTVCRVKQWAKITGETADSVSYKVIYVHEVRSAANTEFCAQYIGEFNARAMTRGVSFTLYKNEFTRSN